MELSEVVQARRMVRSFDSARAVPEIVINNILKHAIRAPSAGHTQGRRFLVLDDITSRELFWSATSDGEPNNWRDRMQTAPVLIVCFSDQTAYRERYAEPDKSTSSFATVADEEWAIPYWHVDTGMAAMILLLAAEDLGLGACFFSVPKKCWPRLFDTFAVPSRLTPVGVISVGYPAVGHRSRPSKRRRLPLEEVVSYGSFDRSPAG